MVVVQRLSHFLLSVHFTLGMMVLSFAGVIFILFTTSPIGLGPVGMLAAFGVFYIWFLALLLGAAHVAKALFYKRDDKGSRATGLTSRAAVLAVSWAFAPLILVALQSIGQLYLISAGLVLLFELLATIYIMRR